MIPKEILKQVRRIQITTNRLVNDVFAGQYSSVFKGRGMEFHEVRPYEIGDDIRMIDWNVTARYGHPYVKKFIEERQLTIMIVLDLSASEFFGSSDKFKSEIAAEVASIIAFSSIKNNDKVGMLIFTDTIEKYVPPLKTTTHALRIIRDILYFKPEHKKTDIAKALEYLYRMLKKKAVVFLISDFLDDGFLRPLKIVSNKHDIIAINIADIRQESISRVGFVKFRDNETGEVVFINTNDSNFTAKFEAIAKDHQIKIKDIFAKSKIDAINLYTGKSYIEPLLTFFHTRQRRLWR